MGGRVGLGLWDQVVGVQTIFAALKHQGRIVSHDGLSLKGEVAKHLV